MFNKYSIHTNTHTHRHMSNVNTVVPRAPEDNKSTEPHMLGVNAKRLWQGYKSREFK